MIGSLSVLKNSTYILAIISCLSTSYAADFTDPLRRRDQSAAVTVFKRKYYEIQVRFDSSVSLSAAGFSTGWPPMQESAQPSAPVAGEARKAKRVKTQGDRKPEASAALELLTKARPQDQTTSRPFAEALLKPNIRYEVGAQQASLNSALQIGNTFSSQESVLQMVRQLVCQHKTYADIKKAFEHPSISYEKQAEVQLLLAFNRFKNRTDILNDAQACDLLDQVSQDQLLPSELRSYADYFRAVMGVHKRGSKLPDAEIHQLLVYASKDQHLHSLARVTAFFYIGVIAFEKRVSVLTDAQTYGLFSKISQNQIFTRGQRSYADYYRGVMGAERRTSELTEAQIYDLLVQASQDDKLPKNKQYEALILRVQMRLENRINGGDDEKDISSLTTIVSDLSIDKTKRAQASEIITALLRR